MFRAARSRPNALTLAPWPLALVMAVSASVAASAFAQEVFELDESYDWQQQTRYDPATPRGQLQAIRKALAEERSEAARELAEQWIKERPNDPLLVEAYLLRGDAKAAQRRYYDALFDYEYVVRQFTASEQFHTALAREYEIARLFASGVKRRMLGMRIIPAAGEAEELFIRIQERSPGSDLGEKASLALGDFYFDRAEMSAAAAAYDLFLVNYPDSRFRERVMLRLIQASLATFKGPRFDPRGLIDAAERIKAYRRQFPAAAERMGADALLLRIDESLALKMYYSGGWYERTSQRVSAVYLYRRVVRAYPRTIAAGAAIQRLEALGDSVVEEEQGSSEPGRPGPGSQGSSLEPRQLTDPPEPIEPTVPENK